MQVKICGLRDAATVEAALDAGADYLGFVFFAKSPRNLSLEAAAPLGAQAAGRATRVALVVNPDDALVGALADLPIDLLQLHGAETPERAAEIRARAGKPVMKAVGLAHAADLARIDDYDEAADMVLVDAKPPPGGVLPGGNGLAFDWRLLEGRSWTRPWMLAGGLTPDTVAAAGRLTAAPIVDVSTGVESAPGVKDIAKIRAFVAAARAA